MLIHPTYHVLAQLISLCMFGMSLVLWVYYSCVHSSKKPRSSYFAGAVDAIGYTRRNTQQDRSSKTGTATAGKGRSRGGTETEDELLGASMDKPAAPIPAANSGTTTTAASSSAAASIADAATPAAGNGDSDDDDAEGWLQVNAEGAFSPVQLVRQNSYLHRCAHNAICPVSCVLCPVSCVLCVTCKAHTVYI